MKTRQCHYSPCQLGIFFSALRWLIWTPGHDENWQKVTQKVNISHLDNFEPYRHLMKYRNLLRDRHLLLYIQLQKKNAMIQTYSKGHRFSKTHSFFRRNNLLRYRYLLIKQVFPDIFLIHIFSKRYAFANVQVFYHLGTVKYFRYIFLILCARPKILSFSSYYIYSKL